MTAPGTYLAGRQSLARIVELPPRPRVVAPQDPEVTMELWKRQLGVADGDVPWWAVALLDLPVGSTLHRARRWMQDGTPPHFRNYRAPAAERLMEAWVRVVELARRVEPFSPEDWLNKAYDQYDAEAGTAGVVTRVVREAMLSSVRAFIQFVNYTDEEDQPLIVKDFQVRTIRAMRQQPETCILLPYEYGKSFLSSMVVPVMDWAEWPNATEGRIYMDDSFAEKWIKRLMALVEHNDRLHRAFPWIRRPQRGDRSHGTWSTEGFAIAGRRDGDKSFEPFTLKRYAVGKRFARVGADDWVNTKNAKSIVEQEAFYEYFKSGVLTMGARLMNDRTIYGTRWGTVYLCGTLYDKNDVNYRVYRELEKRGRRVIRFDVYPSGHKSRQRGETLWPERHPIESVKEQERRLGPRSFKLRCRNMVDTSEIDTFPEDVWREKVEREEYQWLSPPQGARLLVALDPGKGRKSKYSKNPAWVLYAEVDRGKGVRSSHFVAWGRMEGTPFTEQCSTVVEIARRFFCAVCIEDNGVQSAYHDYIRTHYPDVEVVDHTTGNNINDTDSGIEMFKPLMHSGLLVAHCGNAPEHEVQALRDEFTRWPTFKFRDIVVAAWMARYQMRGVWEGEAAPVVEYQVPDYVTRFTGGWVQEYAIGGRG